MGDLSDLKINRDSPRRSSIPIVIGALVLAALGVGIYFAATRLGPSNVPMIQTGLVRRVAASESGAILSASGYILPDRKADVNFKMIGRLEWIGVDIGSQVKEGQVIARLANADLAAQVEEAKVGLADAQREYDRWKKIVEDGIEAREKLDKMDTALKLAAARVKSIEAQFEYTLLRAPFSGVVTRKIAQTGETVGPQNASVFTIVDRTSLEMIADVNEVNIGKIRHGQKVEVTADALPDRKYKGEVRQVVPTADRQKGIVQVKIRLLDLDDVVLPEMAARALFLRDDSGPIGVKKIIAPRGAVRDREGRKVVFVVEGNRVRQVTVEVGPEGEDGIEILKGLLGGEIVAVGGDALHDGVEIRVEKK